MCKDQGSSRVRSSRNRTLSSCGTCAKTKEAVVRVAVETEPYHLAGHVQRPKKQSCVSNMFSHDRRDKFDLPAWNDRAHAAEKPGKMEENMTWTWTQDCKIRVQHARLQSDGPKTNLCFDIAARETWTQQKHVPAILSDLLGLDLAYTWRKLTSQPMQKHTCGIQWWFSYYVCTLAMDPDKMDKRVSANSCWFSCCFGEEHDSCSLKTWKGRAAFFEFCRSLMLKQILPWTIGPIPRWPPTNLDSCASTHTISNWALRIGARRDMEPTFEFWFTVWANP